MSKDVLYYLAVLFLLAWNAVLQVLDIYTTHTAVHEAQCAIEVNPLFQLPQNEYIRAALYTKAITIVASLVLAVFAVVFVRHPHPLLSVAGYLAAGALFIITLTYAAVIANNIATLALCAIGS